jgi:benzoyl-CoA 2,3-dioxygenase component B
MFTYFTDRDGKYQLLALAESGFDPLSRTTRFMLTEEAHHMFVGETGVLRVVRRTCELMKQNANDDVRAEGGIDLPTLQKYINFWYSVSLDLFGGEISSNAATFFARPQGPRQGREPRDHLALEGVYGLDVPTAGDDGSVRSFEHKDIPLRNAMNEVLRDEYVIDSQRGVDKWNRAIAEAGVDFVIRLPNRRFHRRAGIYADMFFNPEGEPISREEWERRKGEWLPNEADDLYIESLMQRPVYEPNGMAHWIAPPPHGIKGQPVQFEYVKRHA